VRPTAMFGVTDHVALKVISVLKRIGIGVPEDISVVGYDGVVTSMNRDPVLTTIRQPLKQLGERSVELLLDLIEHKVEPGKKELLPTALVAGGTARAPQDFQSKQPE
jgi:LacI family repressor for deo operon, udp, cdd, tsx, nupC, and nupG